LNHDGVAPVEAGQQVVNSMVGSAQGITQSQIGDAVQHTGLQGSTRVSNGRAGEPQGQGGVG
ncbi:hypothetical protein HK405_008882, partial [Cladochytrium tenue]